MQGCGQRDWLWGSIFEQQEISYSSLCILFCLIADRHDLIVNSYWPKNTSSPDGITALYMCSAKMTTFNDNNVL